MHMWNPRQTITYKVKGAYEMVTDNIDPSCNLNFIHTNGCEKASHATITKGNML
jgi:hypothetical protein